MSDELARKLETMVRKMPAFPQSVQRVMAMTSDLNCSQRELVQVIEHDPVMTVKILTLLNSAYYNLPRKITSIKRSVVYIGFNTVKNLALSIATIGTLPKKNNANFDADKFLLHSLWTGAIAKTLGHRLEQGEVDESDCFVGGLIHDFGKIVFAQNMPAEFSRSLEKCRNESISLHQAEQDIIGADHSEVGLMTGEKWGFPESLVACMGEHHQPTNSGNAILDCVIAANQLSKKIALGHSGHQRIEDLPETVANRFGLGLDDLAHSLGDLATEKEEIGAFALI